MKMIFAEGNKMKKNISVIENINRLYDSFFEQEKKIGNYILNNYKEVVNMTISELAKNSGTSVASVSRFCKKCDVDGFHHLKIALAREIVEGMTTYRFLMILQEKISDSHYKIFWQIK